MKDFNGEQPLPNENEPVKNECSIARQDDNNVIDNNVDSNVDNNVEDSNEKEQVSKIVDKETDDSLSLNGSPIGKFKSVDALYSAYNNLQAEFTKKCQKLSELQKEIGCKEEAIETTNQDSSLPYSEATRPLDKTYDYLADTWDAKVEEFLKEHPEAKTKAEAICIEKLNDPTLSLRQAYDRVLANEYKAPNKLAEDDTFLNEYIYNSEKIKQKVLQDYFSSLKVSPTPFLMSKGFNAVTTNQPKVAGSLDEAGKMAVSLLKQIK